MANEGGSPLGLANSPEGMPFFQQYELLAKSGLFDAKFYLKRYKDVAKAGVDPLLHYLETGGGEGRDPHARFDSAYYAEQCAQRGIAAKNPLLHFLVAGRALGIAPNRKSGAKRAAQSDSMIELLARSGLFDARFYQQAYGLQFSDEQAALRHFFNEGYREGKRPNLYFDPTWYLELYPDVRAVGAQPLYHYFASGEREGRLPSRIFDPVWYRKTYAIPDEDSALAHFLANRTSCRFSPLPDFDAVYYGDVNKDVRTAGVDPFEHFFLTGFREGRNPSPRFNLKYYVKRYLGGELTSNPFLHYLEHKHEPGVYGAPPEDEASIARAVKQYTRPAAEFEEFKPIPPSAPRKAKVLAYYLPQFHAFPENDEWWGRGFTEWTNIARGVSRFEGHYQPRIPRDLGFYTLDSNDVLKRQAELAKGGGIYGFVYYYYWFNGKRLLDKPVERFLADDSVDMPFALMWANENWTRRWDGDEHEILISQDYDPEDDARLVADFARHFRDSRYIRVGGRPLLMIYRPGIIPDCKGLVARWRALFKEQFGEDPILVMAQAFDDTDPNVYGFDGAIEFPPHKLTANMPSVNDHLKYLDVEFAGKVFSYDDVVTRSVSEPMPSYPLIKTAVPGWDNDARRQGTGLILHGSLPAKYEVWLGKLIAKAQEKPFFGERFVCINAWNEWCEAAYLEPDLHYGAAYLNATGRAVTGIAAAHSEHKLLLVGHDAFPSGAQLLLLNIARGLKRDHGVQVEFLLLEGGKLEKAYRDTAPITFASAHELATRLDELRLRGFTSAVVNTTAAAHILPALRERGFEAVCLVHELPRLIREKNLGAGVRAALELANHAVFPAAAVRDQVTAEAGIAPAANLHVLPQGIYKEPVASAEAIAAVRAELGMQEDDKLVLGVGYADLRKGFDLFLQLWRLTNSLPREGRSAREGAIHFCWLGDMDPGLRDWLNDEVADAERSGTFHLPGYRRDVAAFYLAASAYALTSREDPFPTVVHEALSAGLPVFVFDESGGMPDFLAEHGMGTVVPRGDVVAMARALSDSLLQPAEESLRERRRDFVHRELDFGDYVRRLIHLALPRLPAVSVAIPNYNYARFMPERLASVFQQTHPVQDVLVLDDCSSDDSLPIIQHVADQWQRRITLIANEQNSGSVFAQWRKAAERTSSEYLWIAEADDSSEPRFLSAVLAAMREDPRTVLGFSDSRTIHLDGSPMWDSYKSYYAKQEMGALTESHGYGGADFARRYLSVRNLILNVSAVVWRRDALLRALTACQGELREFRMAGDWRLYLEALMAPDARVAYVADPLNVHRRHAQSVTHALDVERHVAEIEHCQKVAADALKLGTRARAAQERYVEEVRKQLTGESVTTAGKSSTSPPRRRASARRRR